MTTKEERTKLLKLSRKIPALPYIRTGYQCAYRNQYYIEAGDGVSICKILRGFDDGEETATYMTLAANLAPDLAREVDELTTGYDAITNPPDCICDLCESYPVAWSDNVLCLTTDDIFVAGYRWQNKKDPNITGWTDQLYALAAFDVIRWWPLPKVVR